MTCLIELAAAGCDGGAALEFGSEAYSFVQLHTLVTQLTQSLQNENVSIGDRVIIQKANSIEHITLWFSLIRLGAVMVPLNPKLTDRETNQQLAIAMPAMHYLQNLKSRFPNAARSKPQAALGLFTSGTTGVPKLVELSRENLDAMAKASELNLGDAKSDVWLGTLPLFHIGGLAMVYRWARVRGTLILESGFDTSWASDQFDRGVTQASLVPTTLQRLLDHRNGRAFSNIKAVLIGGAPMSKELLQRAKAAQLPVLQTWGMTECCSQITTERRNESDGSTAGSPIEGVEVRTINEQGQLCQVDQVGELQVKGPTLALGLPEWFSTKDLGSIDARGRVTVAARRVDLIISGGENIYPAEIESVFQKHHAVVDVAVVGAPHSQWGQVPVAFVVVSEPVSSFQAFLDEQLSRYKHPRRIITVPAIPRNSLGKIDRLALKNEVTNLNWAEDSQG